MADIVLARVLGAHGLKGDVALKVFAEEPKTLLRCSFPQGRIKTIKKGAKDVWIAHIDGVDTREAAEAMKGAELRVERSMLPEIAPDEYYLSDLAGLAALHEGKAVGRVSAAVDFGAGVLLDIALDNGRSLYLPFRAPFVGRVDLAVRTLEIEGYEAFL